MRENDKEFVEAIEAMWREASEAKKVALAIFIKQQSWDCARSEYFEARAREKALCEAYEKVSSIVMARHDRELAELRGEG